MKMKITKMIVSSLSIATILLTIGCASSNTANTATVVNPNITEESLGLRKTNLYTEAKDTVGEATKYATAATGTSTKIERAFENAPPMIPHSVDGMLPIKINKNDCLSCHLPANAKSMKASMPNLTEIPKSHFTDFRPDTKIGKDGKISKEGKSVDNTSDFKTTAKSLTKLSSARFNCSQCHAPQSTQKPLVDNTFKADFRSKNGKSSSNLLDTINEGVK